MLKISLYRGPSSSLVDTVKKSCHQTPKQVDKKHQLDAYLECVREGRVQRIILNILT